MRLMPHSMPVAVWRIAVQTWLAFLCVLQLVLSTSAFAQNVNTFINIFQGVIQRAVIHEAQFQWKKLPPNEIACIDQALHLEGATLNDLINRGVMPSDPRLSQLRSNCHVQVGQQSVQRESVRQEFERESVQREADRPVSGQPSRPHQSASSPHQSAVSRPHTSLIG